MCPATKKRPEEQKKPVYGITVNRTRVSSATTRYTNHYTIIPFAHLWSVSVPRKDLMANTVSDFQFLPNGRKPARFLAITFLLHTAEERAKRAATVRPVGEFCRDVLCVVSSVSSVSSFCQVLTSPLQPLFSALTVTCFGVPSFLLTVGTR